MGIVLSRVFQALFGSKEVRILILGLDNAGKTTILYRLQNEADDNIQTIPTIGFNVETLQYKNIKFQVWFRALRCVLFDSSLFGSEGGGGVSHFTVDDASLRRRSRLVPLPREKRSPPMAS